MRGKMGGIAAALLAVFSLSACAPEPPPPGRIPTGGPPLPALTPAPDVAGNPERGRALFTPSGCGTCHTVRGVSGAAGLIGPNLTNVALRPTIAGDTMPNTPDSMARWILDPPSMKPGTLMLKLNLTEQDARDLVAFLYSQPYNPPGR